VRDAAMYTNVSLEYVKSKNTGLQAAVGDEVTLLGCDGGNASLCVTPTLSTRIPPHLLRVLLPDPALAHPRVS
jgi:hypothetical protein